MSITDKKNHDRYPALPKSLPRDTFTGATPTDRDMKVLSDRDSHQQIEI